MLAELKARVRALMHELDVLQFAYRDPRTPWYAKAWLALVLAYALSPIDLIPDFVPVLGYLDDLILVPLGIAIAIRLLPPDVVARARAAAESETGRSNPLRIAGMVVVVLIWVLAAVWAARLIIGLFGRG